MDLLRHGGMGEFLAPWCRVFAACALLMNSRTRDSLPPAKWSAWPSGQPDLHLAKSPIKSSMGRHPSAFLTANVQNHQTSEPLLSLPIATT